MIIDFSQLGSYLHQNFEVREKVLNSELLKVERGSFSRQYVPNIYVFGTHQVEREDLKYDLKNGAGVGFNLNLYNGHKDAFEFKYIDVELKESIIHEKITQKEVLFSARSLYWDLVFGMQAKILQEEYSRQLEAHFSLINAKVKSGLLNDNELLLIKKIKLDLEQSIIEITNKYENDKVLLSKLLNIDSTFEINPKDIDLKLEKSNDEKLSYADLKMDLANYQKNKAELLANKYLFINSFDLNFYGEHSFTRNNLGEHLREGDRADQVVGVKLTVNLISEKNTTGVQKASELINVEKTKLQNAKDELELSKMREFNVKNILFFEQKIAKIIEKIELNQKIYTNTFQLFKRGVVESGTLNDALKELMNSKKELLELKINQKKLLSTLN